jgi:hypothetical protein
MGFRRQHTRLQEESPGLSRSIGEEFSNSKAKGWNDDSEYSRIISDV